jgi:hypothetical protein
MTDRHFPFGELLATLDGAPPFALLAVLNAHLKEVADAQEVSLLLADYGERRLERLDEGRPSRSGESVDIDAGAAGRAFRRQEVLGWAEETGHRVYVPVTVRADRLGVLDVLVPEAPTPEVLTRLGHVATTLAYVIAAARPYTDVFERVRRYKPLELAAEIQWSLLPALAYEGDVLALAGMLEPAYEFGGDNFDYAVEEGAVTVSVTDAMGHGLRAAVVGGLVVNALRNARRSGADLTAQAAAANVAVSSQFHGEHFVSGLLMRVDLGSGSVVAVNAGHPAALRVRAGRVGEVSLDADFPLGLFPDSTYRAQELALAPGDRIVLHSDGVLEATSPDGAPFGAERLATLLADTASLSPPEVARLVTSSVVAHRHGNLRDDVTLLCLDRKPGGPGSGG